MKKGNKNVAATQDVAAAQSAQPVAEKKVKINPKVEFFTPLIEEGKYTAKELLEKALESGQFEKLTESTLRTFLTDSKNPKYNRFPRLVVKGADGKLSFSKETASAE